VGRKKSYLERTEHKETDILKAFKKTKQDNKTGSNLYRK